METDINAYKQYWDLALKYGSEYGLKILLAIAIFLIGKRIARAITNLAVKTMRKQEVDIELIGFIDSLLYWGLFAVIVVAALGQLGIQTASFVAILGAAGLAIGLALQGSLSNFAAGVLIILLRPFRVGEFVDIAGTAGTVHTIKIFTTELRTGDNKAVIIPNARVLDSNITNFSSTGSRRVDMVIGIGYDDDIDKARDVIKGLIAADSRILSEPAPIVAVTELADSSVNFIVRPWVCSADYWGVHNDMIENIKKSFDKEGISIPYPQRQVHTTVVENN
ncbi:mechanosensitive ion channel [Arenicella sp. 4NH20-0111]|uniref:mechanosensitive ion channel family protein n=1 Tax=Arenicella sp. 4NH20-0111 TaxID=3127648 RepID=UPI00310C25EE